LEDLAKRGTGRPAIWLRLGRYRLREPLLRKVFPLNQTLTARLVDELRTHRMLNAIDAMRSLKHVATQTCTKFPF